jgi:hypothetical protein
MLRVANHADAQDRRGLRLARIVRSAYHRATWRWPTPLKRDHE